MSVKILKVKTLPTTLSPDTLYLVQNGLNFDQYVTDKAGGVLYQANSSGGGGTGVGISSINRTGGNGAAGTVDTYTIYYTNGATSTFSVQNGANGVDGVNGTNGINGINGVDGINGIGISSIVKTAGDGSPGTVDTYTITLTNSDTTQFTVYNGKDSSLITGPWKRSVLSAAGSTITVDNLDLDADGIYTIKALLVTINGQGATTYMYANNDLVDANYSRQSIHADNASVTGARSSLPYTGPGGNPTVSATIGVDITIRKVAGYPPTATTAFSYMNGALIAQGIGAWLRNNSENITSLQFKAPSGSWAAGSEVRVYRDTPNAFSVVVGPVPPSNPVVGQLWLDTN